MYCNNILASSATIAGVELFSDVYGASIRLNSWRFWCFGTGWGNVIALSSPVDYRYCFPTQGGYGLQNMSDSRIKQNVNDINDDAIDKIMSLKPKSYDFCRDKDTNKRFGFIAQDVLNSNIPELVIDNQTEFIANIYCYASCHESTITIDKDISNILKEGDFIKVLLDNEGQKEIMMNEKNNKYKKRYVQIKRIINNNSFEIDSDILSNEPEEIKHKDIFIYGSKINDFKTLDYKSIFSLNVRATQELYKLIQQQNQIIQDLQNRLSILENK